MKASSTVRLLCLSLIILLLPGCSVLERVTARAEVQKKCGALVEFHRAMSSEWNGEMEDFRRDVEAIPNEGIVASITAPFKTTARISQALTELNRVYGVFAKNVASIDPNGLPQDVASRLVDVQSQVAYQAKLIDEAASMSQGVFSSALAIVKWLDAWDRQEEIYSQKTRALIDAAKPYGFSVEWED